MTRPETAIARVAALTQEALRAVTPDGRGAAHYPARADIATFPTVLLYWIETPIEHGSEQYWYVAVKGQLFSALRGKLASDIARADPLLVPIVDAFAAGTAGYGLATEDRSAKLADYCRVDRVVPSLIIEYPLGSGAFYYGAEVYWSMKMRRFTGEA